MARQRIPPAESGPPEIAEYERAIVLASEENWAFHNVPAEERDRLRPGVVALAKAVADGLRAEHAARTQQP